MMRSLFFKKGGATRGEFEKQEEHRQSTHIFKNARSIKADIVLQKAMTCLDLIAFYSNYK
jgi:hypothetical protein